MFNSYPQAGAEFGSNSSADYFFRRGEIDTLESVAAFQPPPILGAQQQHQ